MRNQNDYERTRRTDGTGAFWLFVFDLGSYLALFAAFWLLICLIGGEWFWELLWKGEACIAVIFGFATWAERSARK